MGLDMYLSKRTFVGNKYRNGALVKIVAPKPDPADHFTLDATRIQDERISEITEEVGYWRKANAIHKWFVDNCQDGEDDCREAKVSTEQLERLLAICKKVKAASNLIPGKIENGRTMTPAGWQPIMEDGFFIENPATAKMLLPAIDGFFFGSTNYDKFYLDDINQTIEILEAALADGGGHFYYHSSW